MLSASVDESNSLSRAEWLSRRDAHQARVAHWASDRTSRRSAAVKDPVFDFMFDYYSFRPAHLERWSPGAFVTLRDATPDEVPWCDRYEWSDGSATLLASSFPAHRRQYLEWAIRYLKATADRPPTFHCFGLHEWAMVYKSDKPRHEQVPMRLSQVEIDRVVEDGGLRCSHFDAFRFFTPQAMPLNRNALTRESTPAFDQPGCLHVNMDLYKFAYKIAPWCPSELVADAFMVAIEARRLDMRASPYDLSEQGFDPIPIERPDGRELYLTEQRRIAALAQPIRGRVLEVYEALGRGGHFFSPDTY